MADALGEGWLIPLILAVVTLSTSLVLPLAKWIASRWREPLQKEVAARTDLQVRLDKANEQLADERLRRMFLEAQVDAKESELENWKTGRWER